MSKYKNIFRKF